MRRLKEAGIRVFLALGNHDAENRFLSRLDLSDNVHRFSSRRAESIRLDELETTLHGRSFPERDVGENLALGYPPPVAGHLNIGVLHTVCEGRPEHASYAPCRVDQLVHHGYQYWALGHVHARETVHADPYIVYPGNIQGRHVRESGAKGATLVSVEDGHVAGLEAKELDVIRWQAIGMDLSALADRSSVLEGIRERLQGVLAAADGRGVALRICLSGETPLCGELFSRQDSWREEIETLAANLSGDLWLEKLEVQTRRPQDRSKSADPTIAGKILQQVQDLQEDAWFQELLRAKIEEVRQKTPAAVFTDDFLALIERDASVRVLQRAQSLTDPSEESSHAF